MTLADRQHRRTANDDGALTLLIASACTLLPFAFLADLLNSHSHDHLAEALMSVAAITPNAVAILLRRRRIARHQDLEATRRGDLARPPLLVVGILSSALLLLANLYVAVIGFIVGFVEGFIEGFVKDYSVTVTGGDAGKISLANDLAIQVLAVPFLIVSAYMLARRASHYLAHHTTLWLATSISLYVALALLINVATSYVAPPSDYRLTPIQIALSILILPILVFVSWIGKQRAESTHSQFVMARLFRQLRTEDRAAVLDLLRETVLKRESLQPETTALPMRSANEADSMS